MHDIKILISIVYTWDIPGIYRLSDYTWYIHGIYRLYTSSGFQMGSPPAPAQILGH
jgi:hypothetical protein